MSGPRTVLLLHAALPARHRPTPLAQATTLTNILLLELLGEVLQPLELGDDGAVTLCALLDEDVEPGRIGVLELLVVRLDQVDKVGVVL